MEDISKIQINFSFEVLWSLDLDAHVALCIFRQAIFEWFVADAIECRQILCKTCITALIVIRLENAIRHIETE